MVAFVILLVGLGQVGISIILGTISIIIVALVYGFIRFVQEYPDEDQS